MTQTPSTSLFQDFRLGGRPLFNRVALAPLTRGRANEQHVPSDKLAGVYYEQRSGETGASLIISEGAGISRQGLGWYRAPGIFNDEQVEAWKPIIKRVQDAGSVFSMQLWHMGRQANSPVTGQPIVSASAIAVDSKVTTIRGAKQPYEVPESLSATDIAKVVADYAEAAKRSFAAGADFVEIHAANGYLVDQFLQSVSNKRDDEYGGDIDRRLRFLREVVTAVVAAAGSAQKVGVRLSPNGQFGDMGSADNLETFDAAIKWSADQGLAYVHVLDGLGFGFHKLTEPYTLARARKAMGTSSGKVALIGNVGYTAELANQRISDGDADVIAFGRPFIATPDLTHRFREGLELAPEAEYKFWWGWELDEEGYTTWPAHT